MVFSGCLLDIQLLQSISYYFSNTKCSDIFLRNNGKILLGSTPSRESKYSKKYLISDNLNGKLVKLGLRRPNYKLLIQSSNIITINLIIYTAFRINFTENHRKFVSIFYRACEVMLDKGVTFQQHLLLV